MNAQEVANKLMNNLSVDIKEIITVFETKYKNNRNNEYQFAKDYPNVTRGLYDGKFYEYNVDMNGINLNLSSTRKYNVFSVSEEIDGLKYRSTISEAGMKYQVLEKDDTDTFIGVRGFMAFNNYNVNREGRTSHPNNKPEMNNVLELIFEQNLTPNKSDITDLLSMMCDIEVSIPLEDLEKIIKHQLMIRNVIEGKDNTPVNRKALKI